MSLSKRNANRCLQLLWECRSYTELPEQRKAYEPAISSLHAYLTDVLPATLPCVRANAQHGVIELFQDEDARAQEIDLFLDEGDKLGIVLDKINVNEWSGGVTSGSPIVIALVKPGSAAGKDNRLARGDQVLRINGHSLSQVSFQRARWLLDSAERSRKVCLSIIASGLIDGLKLSISRHDINSSTPQASRRYRSRSRESLDKKRVQRLLMRRTEPSPKIAEKNAFQMQPTKPHSQSSLHSRPGFTPSIGSQHGSDHSLVSSTVEKAAHIARSSTRSSRTGASFGMPFKKRKVKKMHIMKGASGLGLRIIGGKGSKYGDMGIFVRQLEGGGAAFNDQRLHPGDELLMVDGKTLVGLTHDEAVAVLKATQKLVQLVVATEHIEGDSIDSSMQSIPEKMIKLVGIMDRQVESGQPHQVIAATDAPAVAPEVHKSPLRNTFESDEFEMKTLSISAEHPSPELETAFHSANVRTIEVKRSEGQPLGFSIRQGHYSGFPIKRTIFIQAIDPHGPVGKSNQLHEGDQLLKANKISLENCTREEALDVLTALKGDIVTLEVMATKQKQILLERIPGQPLGIQLTSAGAGAMPVVIVKKVALGSPAHESGKLCVGDQLVSVNGMSVFAMNVDQVKGLLASIPGEEIKLVVLDGASAAAPFGCDDNLPSRPDSLCAEKTKVEQGPNHSDNVGAIEVEREMDFATTASPEVPGLPPLLVDTSKPEESGEGSDEDSIGHTAMMRISQPVQSRPESSFIEVSVDFRDPESLQPTLTPSVPEDKPPVPDMLPLFPSSSPHVHAGGLQGPPDGFLAMQFSMKKRPRGGLGITLIASEGPTTGFFMVRRVTPNGAAAKDGRLQMGDRLVSVNGVDLLHMAHAAVLQALKEALKDVTVVVWRDPHHHLSSMLSLGSNLSGSHSSLLSEDGSPSLGAVKRHYTQGLPSPAARDSPLAARLSYAGCPPSPKVSLTEKRWSDSDILATLGHKVSSETRDDPPHFTVPPHLPETKPPPEAIPSDPPEGIPPDPPEFVPPNLPEAAPPDLPEAISPDLREAIPSDLPPPNLPDIEAVPPDLPQAIPPDLLEAVPPDLPGAIPPDLPEAAPPDLPGAIPPDLPEAVPPDLALIPEVPATLPPEITSELFSEVLPEIPNNMTPPGTPINVPAEPSIAASSSAATPDPSIKSSERLVDSRPRSLQVPRGERTEKSPFEIELKRGILGIGVSLTVNEMGMLVFTSISSRSVISQDGNIKVGDVLLSINAESVVGLSAEKAEAFLKDLPRGLFRLTVMAPFKDVTGEHTAPPPPPQVSTPPAESAAVQTGDISDQAAQDIEENIVEETLQHGSGCSLGFEIEGGSDTPLKYIYIKSLVQDSPAFSCGRFTNGDQLVMVGDTCLIGLSYAEAREVLDLAPATVEVVAQRKTLTAANVLTQLLQSSTGPEQPNDFRPIESTENSEGGTTVQAGSTELGSKLGGTEVLINAPDEVLESEGSTDDLLTGEDPERTCNTEKLHERTVSLIPEERMTVELTRSPGEKLGIGIVGGIDNPNLRHIHVKQVTARGAAARDGRIKRGDRILSVNDLSITGMSNKQALQMLKETGDHVTLVMSRKVGRRRATTPLASARHSTQGSEDTSRAESRRMSPQRSPRTTHRRQNSSSDEGSRSRESSRGPSPQHNRKHYRRKSVTSTQGKIRTFTDRKSTLPRKIKGSKYGVQLVELHKGPTGLGIQLQGSADGGTPITVKAVLRGGPAFRSGKMHVGDEIIEVNGTSFEKLSQQEALKVMKDLPQGKVSIILRDHKAILETE